MEPEMTIALRQLTRIAEAFERLADAMEIQADVSKRIAAADEARHVAFLAAQERREDSMDARSEG